MMDVTMKITAADRMRRQLETMNYAQLTADLKYSNEPRDILMEALKVYGNYLRIFGQDHFPNDFADALRMVELKGCDE